MVNYSVNHGRIRITCLPLQSIASVWDTIPTHALHVHIIMLIVALVLYPGHLMNGLGTRLRLPCLTSLFSRLVCEHENLGAHFGLLEVCKNGGGRLSHVDDSLST